ncbi:putative periplasmic protein [Dissulfuribacter thermophilus]|uniref:Putative periplasmic protein n=1 Tax=Dissulfuribacter thermophilus TaxID=1156395 RepID=A0A1B9F2Q1_9BACT|nr:hypothetical protein [Dissulfuribacter thermophilus]OCC14202.1 putative periplasmic protein [Dissulfuribacter thermophilus]
MREKGMLHRSMLLVAAGCLIVMLVSIVSSIDASGPEADEKAAVASEVQEWRVFATSPGVKILSESTSHPGVVLPHGRNPVEAAYEWLDNKGFEEGRNLYKGKLLYISVGTAVINARPSDPNFIDSRYLAFQRAELEAKAKTAIFLGVDIATRRGSSEREINPEERKELERIINFSANFRKKAAQAGILDQLYTIAKKSARLVEAKLDRQLMDSGVDVAAEKANKARKKAAANARRARLNKLRNISQVSLKAAACAFADVQGTQTIQTFEGSYHNGYQVVVITLWSLNMQRMVDTMVEGRGPAPLPRKRAKQEVLAQLPSDPSQLACLSGVRVFINQHGEHVLLAFGQAGVKVIGGRKDKAYALAGKKARLRAMAAVRSFMGERVFFAATEDMMEVLAQYLDEATGEGSDEYHAISKFQEKIEAVARCQKVRGLHGLFTKELKHPFTGRPMVLKVMAWSPQSQAAAMELGKAIEKGAGAVAHPRPKRQVAPLGPVPEKKGLVSSGEGADPDAF